MKWAALALLLAACAKSGGTQSSVTVPDARPTASPSAAAFAPRHVIGSIYVWSISGGNVVVSRGGDGLVVVDPRVPAVADSLDAFAPGVPRTVIDTHSHRDHTSGNGAVAKAPGVIIAQEAAKTRLMSAQLFKGAPVAAAPEADWPTRTYTDHLALALNGDEIQLSHPAGAHTDGDTIVTFVNEHVVAMGDVFFPGRFPYVDPENGGRVAALVAAIDGFVRDWPEDVRIIPGHGPSVCSKSDLRLYQSMLHDSVSWVAEGRRAGLSREALIARGAPEAYKGWSWPLVDQALWISLVADSGGGG